MMTKTSTNSKKAEKQKFADKQARIQQRKSFYKHFKPLAFAILAWIAVNSILHLPAFRGQVQLFFIRFTLDSALAFGRLLFLPIESKYFPGITVNGFDMQIIMECTAYNFYIFVFFLSLFSPVPWLQRLLTLFIFLAAIFLINNLRFITMGYIGNHNAALFHSIHDYLWNILFGLMVYILWIWRYHKRLIPAT